MLFVIPLSYNLDLPVIPWDLWLYERVAEVRSVEDPVRIEEIKKEVNNKEQEVIKKEIKKPTVKELIKFYSGKYWVDYNLALAIAKCESWLRNVKNQNGSASWIYQQLPRFWVARAKKYWRSWSSVHDIESNIDVSIQMMKYESTRHWNPSKHCRWK